MKQNQESEFERHFRPVEVAKKWNRDLSSVRNELQSVPGVLRFVSGRRTYLRVPASVLADLEKKIAVEA